ncbi:tetratricopeptide repeat protein [candidate division KSB1 bacterium]|nr:tetratricopeptide repeat protein [candidate division KSB1 bacterium]
MIRLQFGIIILFFGFGIGYAQSVQDVAALIRAGEMETARNHIQLWGPTKDLSDSRLFLKALSNPDADSAFNEYQLLIDKYPQSSHADDALFRMAQYKYARGLYKSAKDLYKQTLQKNPQSQLVQKSLYGTALCFQATDQADSANHYFRKCISENPGSSIAKLAQNDFEDQAEERAGQNQPVSPQSNRIEYAVQVGAFSHQTKALMRKAYYEREGFQVKLHQKSKDGTLYYLVWLGSFDTPEEARTFGAQLQKRYGVRYFLVSE